MQPDFLNWVTQELLAGSQSKLTDRTAGYYEAILKVYRHVGIQHFSDYTRTRAVELEAKIDKYSRGEQRYLLSTDAMLHLSD